MLSPTGCYRPRYLAMLRRHSVMIDRQRWVEEARHSGPPVRGPLPLWNRDGPWHAVVKAKPYGRPPPALTTARRRTNRTSSSKSSAGGSPSRYAGNTGQVVTDYLTEVPGEAIMSRTRRFADLRTVRLPRVCVTCNGGWMSRLERTTRPLLEPMIRGFATSLSPAQQRHLASWCQLKCLTLDAYYRTDHGECSICPLNSPLNSLSVVSLFRIHWSRWVASRYHGRGSCSPGGA